MPGKFVPFFVQNFERYVFVRGTCVKSKNTKVLAVSTSFQKVLRYTWGIDKIGIENVKLVSLYNFGWRIVMIVVCTIVPVFERWCLSLRHNRVVLLRVGDTWKWQWYYVSDTSDYSGILRVIEYSEELNTQRNWIREETSSRFALEHHVLVPFISSLDTIEKSRLTRTILIRPRVVLTRNHDFTLLELFLTIGTSFLTFRGVPVFERWYLSLRHERRFTEWFSCSMSERYEWYSRNLSDTV